MSISDQPTARIRLGSRQAGREFTVRDGNLIVVAAAVGAVDVRVTPGLYRIEERSGDAERARTVAVRAGQTYRHDDADLRFPCVAPVRSASTPLPGFAAAVERASTAAARHDGRAAVLIVASRRPAGDDHPVLAEPAAAPPVGTDDSAPGLSVRTWLLPPGGHVLRAPGEEAAERPVWLAAGWQTILFDVTGDPATDRQPVTPGLAVHMTPIGVPWRSGDPAHNAVEAAAAMIRRDVSILRDESVGDDLIARDPILGMIGAHALPRYAASDDAAFDRVTGLLRELLPDHPDVRALEMSGPGAGVDRRRAVAAPPLLAASYRALLAADLAGAEALRPGSPAESIAASIVPRGPWLTWTSGDTGAASADTGATSTHPDAAPGGPAVRRVRQFLTMVAEVERLSLAEVLAAWDHRTIAQATGLPLRVVTAASAVLRRSVPGRRSIWRSMWSVLRRTERPDRAPQTYAGALAVFGALVSPELDWLGTRTDMMRVVSGVRTTLPLRVGRSTGRQRHELITAGHTVVVLSALLEAVDDELGPHAPRLEPAPDEPIRLLDWEKRNAKVAMPSTSVGFEANLRDRLRPMIRESAADLAGLLDREATEFTDDVVTGWENRYRDGYMRLAADVPEFALLAAVSDHEDTRRQVELRSLQRLLTTLPDTPYEPRSVDLPAAHPAVGRLLTINRAALDGSLPGSLPVTELTYPTVGAGWVEPGFRAAVATPSASVSDAAWWQRQASADGLSEFLAHCLTGDRAISSPLLVLGDPGSGKSLLTRVLSGRLSENGRLVLRVPLRRIDTRLPIRRQWEDATQAALGDAVSWAELSARTTQRIVILDGLDECLQSGEATPDYLLRIQRFQTELADLGMPVSCLATSRTSVVSRFTVPDGTLLVRIEDFDETRMGRLLTVWNTANADRPSFRPLSTAVALRCGDLGRNPLLLTMLATYHAAAPEAVESGLSMARLYRGLLDTVIARDRVPVPTDPLADEYRRRLCVAAFGMFNRSAPRIGRAELWQDLAALGPGRRLPRLAGDPSPDAFADFFLVTSTEVDDGAHHYEFLHRTFAEYLVAEQTAALVEQAGAGRDDGLLRALLSHRPLMSRRPTLMFLQQIFDRLPTVVNQDSAAAVTAMLASARTLAEHAYRDYLPRRPDMVRMIACHTANLIAIRLLLDGGSTGLRDLAPPGEDPIGWWRSTVRLWHSGLDATEWAEVVTGFSIGVSRPGEEDLPVILADADDGRSSDVALELAEVTLLGLHVTEMRELPQIESQQPDH
ncbi:hypothetical protein [Actinoplanes sp. NPDC051851]|uniref:NACHT N-terminal helical domain 7-containing protein n=1 Tax=Actinoplanes sp. NPDC051851 TaxID=3154753 RepID=UPI003439F366